jgi:hypothetical protein
MTDRDLSTYSKPWRQGYGAGSSNRKAYENPYLGLTDLAGMYACRQWVEGWREAQNDRDARRTVRSKINAAGREIAQEIASEIKRSSE